MNKVLPALVITAMALPFQATAASNDYEYPYVGIAGGVAILDDLCDGVEGSCDDDVVFGRIYSGARLLPYFSSEVGFTHMDDFGVSGFEVRPQAIDITTNFIWPLARNLDVFAKAGAFVWRTSVSVDEDEFPDAADLDGSSTGVDFKTGLGLRVGLTRHFSLRADYSFIPNFGDSDIGGSDDLHKVSGALQFHF